MSLDCLERRVQSLTIHGTQTESLPFKPRNGIILHGIPRFLIRIYSSQSGGSTDHSWVKSVAARDNNDKKDSDTDIFDNTNNVEAASTVNIHLRWWYNESAAVNLVSWTNSLLFAIQYIIFLHTTENKKMDREKALLSDIKLCVIDTSTFPKGVFIRDMDLIEAYSSYDSGLASLQNTRSGLHYFGEYLSQGALKIENKCRIVSAQEIVNKGLYVLQPEFAAKVPKWANEVVRLRQELYTKDTYRPPITANQIQAAKDIGDLFGESFRFPMAVNFMTLCCESYDNDILDAFRGWHYTEQERRQCEPSTWVGVDDKLPEVKAFDNLLWKINEDEFVRSFKEQLSHAEIALRKSIQMTKGLGSKRNISDTSRDKVGEKLNDVIYLCEIVKELVQDKEARQLGSR